MILFVFCSLLNIEFEFKALSFLSSKREPELRVFYEIPRNNITYIKFEQSWMAKFEISCIISQGKKEIGDSWIIQDSLKDYEATIEKTYIKGELKIQAPPGEHEIKVCVRDLNSQRMGEKTAKVTLKDLRAQPQSISELITYKENDVGADSICVEFEVYNFSDSAFKLTYKIDKLEDSINFDAKEFVNPIKIELPTDSLGYGNKIITVKAGNVERQETLYIKEPFWTKDYEKRVKELYYIAEKEEIDSLLKVPVEHRKECWKKFWAKKDSIYRTQNAEEEYFRRVDYANKKFTGRQEGWRTDRGRVYIKLGKPDEVDAHPFEIDQKPYEIWYYYRKNLKFIFVDKLGFGEYELEYPKYWQGEIQLK